MDINDTAAIHPSFLTHPHAITSSVTCSMAPPLFADGSDQTSINIRAALGLLNVELGSVHMSQLENHPPANNHKAEYFPIFCRFHFLILIQPGTLTTLVQVPVACFFSLGVPAIVLMTYSQQDRIWERCDMTPTAEGPRARNFLRNTEEGRYQEQHKDIAFSRPQQRPKQQSNNFQPLI
ncbi:hypothetical protein E6O75_ATG07802 [Venturia nashicola]|uniref:Uncharacterized protein n=1 Tax=Venturia nashicola TaxID=86259 RepID=A0A4Z1NVV1_9PEZI|nr:hypothetical protein E6O75_ATG07802 [Venturia nashicola]